MWKKMVPFFIVLVLVVGGVGVWLVVRQPQPPSAAINQPTQPVVQNEPQPVPAEPGGGGIMPQVPPVPVTAEQPVPANMPVDKKEGAEKVTAQPVPVSAGVPTPATQHIIQYDGSTFSPKVLIIKKGETVTFVNNGKNPMWVASAMHPTHTVYPTKGGCLGSTFDACSGYDSGSSWSFTFDEVGSWGYHDHLTPSALGKIIVEK